MFEDKVIAITGGTDGIGKALVDALLQRGAKISTCGRNQDKLNQLQVAHPGESLHTLMADVSIEEDCKRFIESTINFYGKIDILINNAGISMRALVEDVDINTLKKVMDTNFWGTVFCTKFALDSIIQRKGTIVAVS